MIETLLLGFFGVAALGAAVLMLVLREPMRVAVALITTMLSLAGVYALLGVHVIAVFQVLIYVGAVMVFMVYAIMLLDVGDRGHTRRYSALLLPGLVGLVALVAVLVHGVWGALAAPVAPPAEAGGVFALQTFSALFLNEYWLHFELVSVLLVAAVVAALAVIRTGRGDRD
jgi:NADH-quinone oxidoreductase subunit J